MTTFTGRGKGRSRTSVLQSENDLHYKVVEFLKRYYPNSLLVPGLGELQDTAWKRISSWKRRYTRGQSDLLVLNHNSHFDGLSFEFKSPSGQHHLPVDQQEWARKLSRHNWKTVSSNNYDLIIFEITQYFRTVKELCTECNRWVRHIDRHMGKRHRAEHTTSFSDSCRLVDILTARTQPEAEPHSERLGAPPGAHTDQFEVV